MEVFAAGKGLEGSAEFLLHGGGVEVAGDGDDDVVGDDGFVVPGVEIVEGDGVDGGVFGLARVGAVGSIGQFDGFAVGDAGGVVVAAGDGGLGLLFGQLELVGFEVGMEQEVDGLGEDGVEVALEAGPADGGGGAAAGGFDGGGFVFELVVELVAVDGGGAAGAPGVAVEGDEAGFGGGFVAAASADEDGAVDEGELVVFLEEDDEAVGEFDAFGLLGFEGVERWDGDLGSTVVRLSKC